MSNEYTVRTLSRVVRLKGKSQFDESATIITKVDQGAGEYIKIEQPEANGEISFTIDEWKAIKPVIDMMFKEIEKEEQ